MSKKKKKNDEQVTKGKELISTVQEAEIGQEVGGDVGQGQDPITHDVAAFLCPHCPHLLESRFCSATSGFFCLLTGGV